MKKIIFLVIALAMMSLTTIQAQNIYAYDLKGAKVDRNTKQVTVSYKLNVAATSVAFDVPGYTVVSTSTVGLTAGVAHSVTLTLDDLPAGNANLAWSVTANSSTTYSTPTRIAPSAAMSGIEGTMTTWTAWDRHFKFYTPRNVAVDNNFDSPYFGNAYVVNGNGGPSQTGFTTQRGIYIFNPLLQRDNYVASSGTTAVTQPAYAGGVSWSASSESPFGVAVGPDGMVYVADGRQAGIHRMNPGSPTANFTTVITGTGIKPFCWVTATNIYAMNIGAFTIDDNTYTTFSNVLEEYPVAGGAKTKDVFDYGASGVQLSNRITGIAPGINGGWWITQGSRNRPSPVTDPYVLTDSRTTPSLIYIDAAGNVKYNSNDDATIKALFGTIGTGSVGSIAISPDGQYLAVAPFRNSQKIRILSVSYAVDDTPTLTNLASYEVSTGSGGTSNISTVLADYSGLAFDAANNLFTTTAGNEWVQVFTLPKTPNTFTTPAPASQPIKIEDEPLEPETEYYVPNDPGNGKTWFPTLKAACDAINTTPITDNLTIWINGNCTEAINTGLVNNTAYSITIKPVEGLTPEIQFTTTGDTNEGPTGAFIIGASSVQPGGTGWTSIAPAKNITIEGLTIRTTGTSNANYPICIIDACEDITIKNCVIEHVGTGAAYAVYLRVANTAARTEPNLTKRMPKNVTIENNEILIKHGGGQGIAIWADLAPAALATGIVIKNNIVRVGTRCVFLNQVNGIDIIGNDFYLNSTNNGMQSYGIMPNSGVTGTVNVIGNKFLELKTAHNVVSSDWRGVKAISTGLAGSTWYIENNYFAGFDKTNAIGATESFTTLVGVRLGTTDACYVRHNTFYLKALSNKPNFFGTSPTDADAGYHAISVVAGTNHIINNLFVSNEDAIPNFLIRGTPPVNTTNNVFCRQAGTANAQLSTGTVSMTTNKEVTSVEFTNAAAGDLSLSGASLEDVNLQVDRLPAVLQDIDGTLRKDPTFAGAYDPADLFVGTQVVSANGIQVICLGNQISIVSDEAIQSVKLFDLQGRLIASKQGIADNVYALSAPSKGIYIVETITASGRNVSKVAVR